MKSEWSEMDFEKNFGELLCKELDADGISVSDDLIARTLAAVHQDEIEFDKQKVTKNERRKHKIRIVTYSLGTVVAACLVLILGISVITGRLRMGSSSPDKMSDKMNFSPAAVSSTTESDMGEENTTDIQSSAAGGEEIYESDTVKGVAQDNKSTPENSKEQEAQDSNESVSKEATDTGSVLRSEGGEEDSQLVSNGFAVNSVLPDLWFYNSALEDSLMSLAASNIRQTEDLSYATNLVLFPENSVEDGGEAEEASIETITAAILSDLKDEIIVEGSIADEEVQYRLLCKNEEDTVIYLRIMQGGEYVEMSQIDRDGIPNETKVYYLQEAKAEILLRVEELYQRMMQVETE